ncbi:hypothetical protein NLI96_g12738 [Meripilus lineatus]|uniref:RlpA-like protein double-psi beta-barrel domain-containing protein n=1 Tax=Meripilus lineatus TaxID=2056292 RepID=A0AAD5UPB2_9APHY|nr:hypothetical protein NLI96_g12738 [Physisporinus lineatus]
MRFFATIPFLTAFLVASTMAEPQPVAAAVGETNDFVARGLAGSLLHLREPEAMAASPGDALMERDTNTHLAKRFDGARFTWFNVGLGSCGRVNVPSDFVVALNGAQWDNRAHCFQTVTVSANGKTAQAQIVDLCPGCPYGGLDFSSGLFQYFAPLDVGVLSGSWNFN